MAKIDWAAARAFYMEDESTSYNDVSAKFGVSVAAIKDYQKRMGENWPELRVKTGQKVAEKLPEKVADKKAEEISRELAIANILESKGLEAIWRRYMNGKN